MNLHEAYLAAQLANQTGGGSADLSNYYTKSQTNSRITAKIAEIVANAPEEFDTLKKISDWIASHSESAAAMDSAITENISKIAKLIEQTALNRSTLGYQRKNQLLNKCVSKTMNGVTATVNADSSITLSGSNTLGNAFVFYRNLQTGLDNQYTDNRKWLSNGEYIVSGSAVGADIQVRMSADNVSEGTGIASKNGAETKFTVTDDDKYVWARILITSAADFSIPVTVYPMIRSADIADSTYEPYKPSVDERIPEIVTLDSVEDYEAIEDKTADFYFIKEVEE